MDHVPFENHAILISMNIRKFFVFVLFVCLLIVAVSCTQTKPTVTLSATRVFHSGHVEMRGTGFTKDTTIYSHLRRPDGTEFPVLPMRTNDRGEFVHDIDTLLLSPGVHEVWVEEEQSKKTSDIVRFEVTSEQK
jgi:hypothetical protein